MERTGFRTKRRRRGTLLFQDRGSGDKLYLRQYNSNGYGGPNVKFTDNTEAYQHVNDTAGQPISAMSTQNQWVSRVVDLSSFAGNTVGSYQAITDSTSPAGTYDIYYGDMAIVGADGTVATIYGRQAGGALPVVYNSGQTNLSAAPERSNSQSDSVQGYTTTTFLMGDHLGSARMLTAAGGWPVSSDTFHPFGLEPSGTASPNHYQYASLERDGESGFDHADFRQLASTQGRWLSPDPYDGSYDAGNPQSFNRYAYVLNNPMGYTDPSGLETCNSEGCIGTCTPGVADACVSTPEPPPPPDPVCLFMCTPVTIVNPVVPPGQPGSNNTGSGSGSTGNTTTAPNSVSLTAIKPTSKWEKAGMYAGCVAGMDPDYALPLNGKPSGAPSDPLNSTQGTTGQRTVYGPNQKTSGSPVTPYNPGGNNSLTPDAAAGGASYIVSLIKCIQNVNKTYP